MKTCPIARLPLTTRRDFLKNSSALLAGASLTAAVPRPGYAAEDDR